MLYLPLKSLRMPSRLTVRLARLARSQIEVVKTRAQVESSASSPGGKLGSFRIASMIAKKEGLRGFYVGGLMTSIHDGVSSGIFFATCTPRLVLPCASIRVAEQAPCVW